MFASQFTGIKVLAYLQRGALVPNFRGSYCLRSLEGQSTVWITEVHSFCQCYNSYQSSTVKTVNNTVVT
ncbi:hypothetical protein HZ326_9959 [Fusarium oxysporum f. sp. albedinis]|nr:hypothetical protein HZ326_9959 [Fusarium oxysporum f. sp. albedinis]